MVNNICKHPIVHMVLYIHPRWLFCDIWTINSMIGNSGCCPNNFITNGSRDSIPSRSQIGNADGAVFAGLGWLWLHDADCQKSCRPFLLLVNRGIYSIFPSNAQLQVFFQAEPRCLRPPPSMSTSNCLRRSPRPIGILLAFQHVGSPLNGSQNSSSRGQF